jgi:hypothetical protein
MTTEIFDEHERAEFSALGFTITDGTASTAHVEGTMQVELKKWGPFHFHLRVVLPGGGETHRLHAAYQDRSAGVRGLGP